MFTQCDFPSFPGCGIIASSPSASHRSEHHQASSSWNGGTQSIRTQSSLHQTTLAQLEELQQSKKQSTTIGIAQPASNKVINNDGNDDVLLPLQISERVASSTRSTAASSTTTSEHQRLDDIVNDQQLEEVISIASSCSSPSSPPLSPLLVNSSSTPNAVVALDVFAAEDVVAVHVPLPLAKESILLENIAIKDPGLRASLAAMLPDIKTLSMHCFDEDVTQLINRKTGWKINLLVSPFETRLLGFLSYRVRGGSVLEIAKLAICNDCRHMGYGRRLVKGILSTAKTLPNVEYVGLSSLAEAVTFYQRLGFKRHDDVKFTQTSISECEEIIPGQIYMEMKIRSNNSNKGKNNGGGKNKKRR